jgi:type IV fimbrial biogenesis protein FimT
MHRILGFTLIELMVTLAVAAIVLSIALPSFNASMLNNKSNALGEDFNTALNYARSEAIKRSARVSICSSDDGINCLGAADWKKGWMVFLDKAASDSTSSVSIGTVLRFWGDVDKRSIISVKKGTTAISFVRFTSGGLLARENAADTDARVVVLSLSGCNGTAKRELRVGVTGMTSASKLACP